MTTLMVTRGQPGDLAAAEDGARGAGGRTYAELTRDVLAVRASIPPHVKRGVLLAEDRYWFAVGLLATWQAGAEGILPASRTNQALQELLQGWPDALVLHDGTEMMAGPSLPERARTLPDTAAGVLVGLPSERRLATLFTSGTTASNTSWSKTARQLLGEAHLWVKLLSLSRSDHVLSTVTPHHIYGLLFGTLLPLSAGAGFTRRSVLLPQEVFAAARDHAATVLVSTPAHLRSLLTLPEGPLGTVRVVLSSGAPLPRATGLAVRERFGVEVIEILGSTETGGIARRRGDVDEPWTPLPDVNLAVDANGGLIVRSPFVPDPLAGHVTSDRVELLPDSRFLHLGRADNVVKIAGRRLDCSDLEARVLALPGVRDAASLAIDVDGLRGVEVWLGVVAPTWTARGIRRALSAHFETSILPRTIRMLPVLPRTQGGKLRREELRAAMASNAEPDAAGQRAAFEIQREAARSEGGNEVRVAHVRIAPDAPYFTGHFPGDPLLPAVAQLAGLILPEIRLAWPDLGMVRLAPRLKWSALVKPGAALTLALTRKVGAPQVEYLLSEGDRACASGALGFSATP